MQTRNIEISKYRMLAVAVLAAGLVVSYAIVAYAQEGVEPTEQEIQGAGISFPVAELGNCRDKTECKNYCDNQANMPACIAFAEKHGLMSGEEAAFARKFKDRLDVGGPGGCRSPRECDAYCSDVTRIEECMSFAEEHGIQDKNIEEGRKILTHLRAGGTMPGGCTSKDSCGAYCSNVEHFEECIAFAEKVGFEPEIDGDISREQLRVVMDLMKRGESPGSCKSKAECEEYCGGGGHFEECIAFAEKAGFMKPEEAEMARKTGGVGPGGCRSERDCNAYCNAPENQEACFSFAEEHGFIKEEDIKHIKEGFASLRAGLAQAPKEVVACLKASLGQNIIQEIEQGTLTPGPAIGNKIRDCFEKFGHQGIPSEVFDKAPAEVLACMKEKFGVDFEAIRSGEKAPGPEIGNQIRACFEQFGPNPADFLNGAPPEVIACIKNKIGSEFERIAGGKTPPGPEFETQVRGCFEEFGAPAGGFSPGESFAPAGREGGVQYKGLPSFDEPRLDTALPAGFDFQNLPPTIFDCVKRGFGDDVIERLKSGILSAPEFAAKVKSCVFEFGGSGAGDGGGGGGNIVPQTFESAPTFYEQAKPVELKVEQFPPEVISCLKEHLSEDVIRSLQSVAPSGEVLDAVRKCYESSQFQPPAETSDGSGNIFEIFRPLLFFLK